VHTFPVLRSYEQRLLLCVTDTSSWNHEDILPSQEVKVFVTGKSKLQHDGGVNLFRRSLLAPLLRPNYEINGITGLQFNYCGCWAFDPERQWIPD